MVISEHYHIATKYWQLAATHTYDLSIIVGVHSLFYSITNAEGQLCVFKEYDKKANADAIEVWNTIIEKDTFLTQPFNTVKLAYNSPYIVLIPDILFRTSFLQAYIESAFSGLYLEQMCFSYKAVDEDKMAVFALPKNWYTTILNTHKNISDLQHVAVEWLTYLQKNTITEESTKVYIHVVANMLHVVVFEKGNLLYFNSFTFSTADDFLYYVLLVYQQLQLDTKNIPLYCSGALVKESKIYTLLYQYIKKISLLPLGSDFALIRTLKTKGNITNANLPLTAATDLEALRNQAEFLPQVYWDLYLLSIS